MTLDECVACGKGLPANHEFVAVPRGRTIAFDPVTQRVWRICEACDSWNLLGNEAAREALPELSARFDNEATAGRDGMTMAVIGKRRVVLLRVGAAPTRLGSDIAASETHANIGAPTGTDVYVAIVLLVLGAISLTGWLDNLTTFKAVFGSRAMMLGWITFLTVRGLLAGRELWRGRPRWFRGLPIAGFPVIAFMLDDAAVPLMGGIAAIVMGTLLGLWYGRRAGVPRGIRWVDGTDAVTYHDGFAVEESGSRALVSLFIELQVEFAEETKPGDREAAWTLWATHRSLAAMLGAFGSKRGRDGLLRLADLSVPERMALLIAVGARLAEPPSEVVAGLRDAEGIAAIAETLDQPAELG